MTVSRLVFLMLLGASFAFIMPEPIYNWTLNTNTDTDKTIKSLGDKPDAYQLLIKFNDNKFNENEIVNGGSKKIFIDVTAVEQVLRGGVTQLKGKYNCKLRSESHFLTGSFNITKTKTINMNVTDEFLIEKSRKEIKEYLQKEIQEQ